MRTPPAELEVDAGLVEALLGDQLPDLVGAVRVVASGWDNVVARVGDDLCVRVPRRALAAPLVQHEADWLPRLAPGLPVDVPAAVAVGAPGPRYPWTWLVCPWFEGRPLAAVAVGERTAVAAQLGGFVAALHQPAPDDAPVSPWRGTPLAEVEPRVLERLGQVPAADAATLAQAWRRSAGSPPYEGPPVWLHGDLHPLNLLADHATEPGLRAVIDWGDLCRGDPATDLAIAWLGFDERGRTAFRTAAAARHPPGDPVWERARGWAVSLGLVFLLDAVPGTTTHGVGEHLLTQLRLEHLPPGRSGR